MKDVANVIKDGAVATWQGVSNFGQSVKNKVKYGEFGTDDSYKVRYAKAKLYVEEMEKQGYIWSGSGKMLAGDGGMTDTGIPSFIQNTGDYGYKINPDVKSYLDKNNIHIIDADEEKIRKENEEAINEQAKKDKARAEEIVRRKGLNVDDENEGILSSVKDFFVNTVWGGVKDLASKAYNWITGKSIDNQSMVKRAITKDLFDKDIVRKNIINAAGSGLDAVIDEAGKSIKDAKSEGVSVYGDLSKDQRDKYKENIFEAGCKGAAMGYGANALSNFVNSQNTIDLILGVGAGLGYITNNERKNKGWDINLGSVQFGHNKE